MLVGNDTDFGRTCGHVDSHIVEAHLLLGSHDILVAWTEDFINLRYTLCTIGHGADSLNTTCFEYLADASDTSSYKNSRIDPTIASWRSAQHNLLTTCNFGRGSKH